MDIESITFEIIPTEDGDLVITWELLPPDARFPVATRGAELDRNLVPDGRAFVGAEWAALSYRAEHGPYGGV